MTTIKFNHEVSKVEKLVFGFAMKLTKNEDAAKDLMQDTLMRAFANREKFRLGTNFKAWLTTIMYNRFVSQYRRRKTRKQISAPVEDVEFLYEKQSNVRNADSIIMMKELNAIVDTLSNDHKEPFMLHHNGFQYNEISEKLDLPIGTVKSRIFHARKKLSKLVVAHYGAAA